MQLNDYITQFNIPPTEVIEFLNDCNWFDMKPTATNGKVELTDQQIAVFTEHLWRFSEQGTTDDLFAELNKNFSITAKELQEYFKVANISDNAQFYITDFLLVNLKQDIVLYTNDEVKALLDMAIEDLIPDHAKRLSQFLKYVRERRKTKYYKDFDIEKQKMENNTAYTFTELLEIVYRLFNDDYIRENEMMKKAAQSKNYADCWLFLAVHCISSIRMTDLERIYHPTLPKPPQQVLDEIAAGTWASGDAREVLLSITRRLELLPLTPNKNADKKLIPNVKFTIPHGCEVFIGTLFALVEAHQQVSNQPGPLIKKIATYDQISRYMGDEIGKMFLESNFRCRKANKSFLQGIEALANEMESEDGVKIKGYFIAEIARSHKGGYGRFASTTATYLQDAAFLGLTVEYVTFELFERGVLSCISSMLLNIVTNNKYKELPVHEQTEMVKTLNLNNREIEDVVSVVNQSQARAQKAIIQAVTDDTPILDILHNIASDNAPSKQPECMCLLSAVRRSCPYSHEQCIGCEYEISTKATLFHMAAEYKRISELYETATEPLEKNKYKLMITNVIVPKLDEMLFQIRAIYGEDVYNDYYRMVKDYVEESIC